MPGSGWWRVLAVAGLLCGAAVPARGGGFQLQDFDAKALGMANAFAATADNPAAVYFNPAGLTQLDPGLHGSAASVMIVPDTEFRADAGHGRDTEMEADFVALGAGFLALKLGENLAVGGGIFTPFGLGVKYPDSWGGRYIVTKASIVIAEGNLTVASKVPLGEGIELSLAAGGSLAGGEIQLKRHVDFRFLGADDGRADLRLRTNRSVRNVLAFPAMFLGGKVVPRWNLAGMLHLMDNRIRLGVSYRDGLHDVEARGRLKIARAPVITGLNGRFTAETETRLPGELRAGIAVEPFDGLTLELDYRWVNWSVLRRLKATVDGPSGDVEIPLEYRDSHYVAVAADYKVTPALSVRGGLLWDQSPVPDRTFSPTVPDNHRIGFSLGVGYEITDGVTVDLAYLGLYIFPRDKDNDIGADAAPGGGGLPRANGRYRTWANLIGITVGLKL
ncbi:MAG: membrane protein [Planctomycetota bacterium]|nr:MAG: membrane protein [Planctomycetota bacterium]